MAGDPWSAFDGATPAPAVAPAPAPAQAAGPVAAPVAAQQPASDPWAAFDGAATQASAPAQNAPAPADAGSAPVIRPDTTKVRAENVGRSIVDAGTLGLYGQFEAAMDSLLHHGSQAPTFGQRFAENRANYEAEQAAMPAYVRVPAQIGGAVGSAALGGPVAAVAGLGKLGAEGVGAGLQLIPGVGRVASALAPIATGAGEGLALGATQGAISGQGDAGDRLAAAGQGAAMGGGLGAAGAGLATGVQSAGELLSGVKRAFTGPGQQSIARQVLEEAAGGSLPAPQQSALPGVPLMTPQAMNSPQLGALQRIIGDDVPHPASQNDQMVQNGVTPAQVAALRGGMAQVSPSAAVNAPTAQAVRDASSRLTGGVQDAIDAINQHERSLWQAPPLQAVPLDGGAIAAGVRSDVAAMRPGFARQLDSGALGNFLGEISDLGPNATLDQLNAIRSDVLKHARTASDAVEASAAKQLGGSMLDRMNAVMEQGTPGTPGTPPTFGQVPSSVLDANGNPMMRTVQTAPGTPGTPALAPNQAAADAYQTARDFTRQKMQTLGFPEIQALVRDNRWGNDAFDPETHAGKFFSTATGSTQGAQRLANVAQLAESVSPGSADPIHEAVRDYLGGRLMQESTLQGVNADQQPAVSLDKLAQGVQKAQPMMQASGSFTPSQVQRMQDVAASARQLRQGTARGDSNSTTYEKLRKNDLLSAVIAQSGLGAAGALGGAYAGYEHGPDAVPPLARIGAGAMLGAGLSSRFAPMAGKALAEIPGVRAVVAGPRNAIMAHVDQALRDPSYAASLPPAPNALAAMAPPPGTGRALTAPAIALAGPPAPASRARRR